jgi:tetratricopeptide (TPR) repeat protein
VFSTSFFKRFLAGGAIIASAACAGVGHRAVPPAQSLVFYTVTAELALARHEPRVAALQYVTAADLDRELLPRAVQVADEGLQPDVELQEAERWIRADAAELAAQRAAARAALSLHLVTTSAAHDRYLLNNAPDGLEAESARLETELRAADDVYGARQVADRLAQGAPPSMRSLRLQGFTALRADDPAAAARSFAAALAQPDSADPRADLTQAWRRARILAGEVEAPLAEAQTEVAQDASAEHRFDYALLLWTARRDALARVQLQSLVGEAQSRPEALRVLALIDFQSGDDGAAATRFTELATSGAFLDDCFYYLGLIAERHGDLERALRSYARVQSGDNLVPSLLRAAAILYKHGAENQAEDLLDRLQGDESGAVPQILAARADLYAQAGHSDRALALLQESRLQYPYSVELRYAMATELEQVGQVDAALGQLRELLKERPDDPAAMNALGYTLADHSLQLRQARALIEQAYTAAPKSAAIRDSLGWVLYRQGRAAEALPYLQGAFDDEPGGDIGAHLGEVLWRLDQRDAAERVWTEARRVDDDNRLVQATRQRLHEQAHAGS